MNCREFEDRLEVLLGAHRGDPAFDDALDHARGCPRCARLLAIARGEIVLHDAGAPDLTSSVMRATVGDPCEALGERICDWIDGKAAVGEAELIEGHLAHCVACGPLAEELRRLNADLPAFREIDPGAGFVEDVLLSTSRRRKRARARPRATIFSLDWRRLMQRPRIALELAYGGAFLLYLLVGTPASPLREAGGRFAGGLDPLHAPTAVGKDVVRLVSDAPEVISEMRDGTAGRGFRFVGQAVKEVGRFGERIDLSFRSGGVNLGAAAASLWKGDRVAAMAALSRFSAEIDSAWARRASRYGEKTEPGVNPLRLRNETDKRPDPAAHEDEADR